MADPFTISLGVLAIVQASASAAQTLYDFVDTVVHAKEEIPLLGREVHTFFVTVRKLQTALKEPAILQYVRNHPEVKDDLDILEEPLKLCNLQMAILMRALEDNTNLYNDGTREIKSFRWYFVKDSVLKTKANLGYTERLLSGALGTLDFIQNLRDRAERDLTPRPPANQSPLASSVTGQLDEMRVQAATLRQAACDNDERTAKLLLEAGVAVDIRDEEGRTALSLAAQHGSLGVARLLLKFSKAREATANSMANTITDGDRWKRSESRRTPLHWAAACGHDDMVGLLLDAGARLETPNASQRTPALEAAIAGHVDTLSYMLDRKASVGARTYFGWTMLHSAASHAKSDLVRLLLDKGAPVEAVYRGGWHGKGKDGMRKGTDLKPLHLAAWPEVIPTGNETAILQLLVQHSGAYVKAPDSAGATPLHYTVRSGWLAGSKQLLKLGASPATKDGLGDTPLHEAVKRSDLNAVLLLVEQYPSRSKLSKNEEGQTALTIARELRNTEIIKCLQCFMVVGRGGE